MRFFEPKIADDAIEACLQALPNKCISSLKVVRELVNLIAQRGKRGGIISDSDFEMTGEAVILGRGKIDVDLRLIAPRKAI